jgi:hypothetical protein
LPAPVRKNPPCMIAIVPTGVRNTSRPRPGQPRGNVENSLCSLCLLGVHRSYASTPLVE